MMHVATTSRGQGQGLTLVEDEDVLSSLFSFGKKMIMKTLSETSGGLFHVQTFSSVRVVLLVRNLVFVGVVHKI